MFSGKKTHMHQKKCIREMHFGDLSHCSRILVGDLGVVLVEMRSLQLFS